MDYSVSLLAACVLAFALTGIAVFGHYKILGVTTRALQRRPEDSFARVILGMGGVLLAHLTTVLLYALVYWIAGPALGGIHGKTEGTALDAFYLSLMSFTTLGVGDVYPHGGLRILSGIEALNCFVLIGWSASFTYVVMKNSWSKSQT